MQDESSEQHRCQVKHETKQVLEVFSKNSTQFSTARNVSEGGHAAGASIQRRVYADRYRHQLVAANQVLAQG